MDKIFLKIFGTIDNYCKWVEKFFIQKPRKKKKTKCKKCHCDCHCKKPLHTHWHDGDLCACGGCKH
tara:strand:+ start:708 stop:905 length:198 start_codon:yes stop_codon:yes gene_type:complete